MQLGFPPGQRKEAEPQAQISVNLFVLTPPRHAPRVRVATPQSLFLQKPTPSRPSPIAAIVGPARLRTLRLLQACGPAATRTPQGDAHPRRVSRLSAPVSWLPPPTPQTLIVARKEASFGRLWASDGPAANRNRWKPHYRCDARVAWRAAAGPAFQSPTPHDGSSLHVRRPTRSSMSCIAPYVLTPSQYTIYT